jgi:hypothetical protein
MEKDIYRGKSISAIKKPAPVVGSGFYFKRMLRPFFVKIKG